MSDSHSSAHGTLANHDTGPEVQGVSADERRQIVAEIDALLRERRPGRRPPGPSPQRKKGVLLPLVVNLAALLFLAGGVALTLYGGAVFDNQSVGAYSPYTTTESLLVEAVQEEAEGAISERERRIEEIRQRLQELQATRDAETGESPARGDTAALAETLEAELQELTRRESSAREQLDSLSELRDQEVFLLRQVEAAYEETAEQLSAGQRESAVETIDQVAGLLQTGIAGTERTAPAISALRRANEALRAGVAATAREPSPSLPTEIANPALERLEALRELVDEAETQLEAGDTGEATRLYGAALSQIESVERAHEHILRTERETSRAENRRLRRRLADAQGRIQTLESRAGQLAAELSALRARADRAGAAVRETTPSVDAPVSSADRERIVDLLDTKVLLREVADSEPVRAQHPGLYEDMESYFDAFGDEKLATGWTRAFAAANRALDAAAQAMGTELPAREAPVPEDQYENYARRLNALLEDLAEASR